MSSVNAEIVRFKGSCTCPICGGAEDDPRGQGRRCIGFLSGEWIHCSRDEHKGNAKYHPRSRTWSHRANGNHDRVTENAPAQRAPSKAKAEPGTIDKIYSYTDENHNEVFQVVRLKPKGFRQRRRVDGKWVWNMNGVKKVPFLLYRLARSSIGRPVWISEGEKSVGMLTEMDEIASCSPGGAGKWLDQYSEWFRDRHVRILPDNDEPGRRHAEQVARSLFGIARSVKIIQLPGLPPGGDVYDYTDDHDINDLERLAEAAPLWAPVAPEVIPIGAENTEIQAENNVAASDALFVATSPTGQNGDVNEGIDDPHRLARIHREVMATQIFYRGEWFKWFGGSCRGLAEAELDSEVTRSVKDEFDRTNLAALKQQENDREGN